MAMRGLTDKVLVVSGRGGRPWGLSFPHDSPVVGLLALKGPVCTEVFVSVPLHALPKVGGPSFPLSCSFSTVASSQKAPNGENIQQLKAREGLVDAQHLHCF